MRGLQRRTLIRLAGGALLLVGCALGSLAGLQSASPAPPGLPAPGALVARAVAAAFPHRVATAAAGLDRSRPTSAARRGGAASGRAPGAAGGNAGRGFHPAEHRALASASGAVVLDGFQVAPGAVSGAARGFDPDGPRSLVLWRVDARGSTRVAEGFSDAEGNLHFPQVAQPGDPLTLVVAPENAPPPSREASDPAALSRAAPLSPVVEGVVPASGGVVLRIAAREATGAVLVASGDGALLGRFDLPAWPAAAARVLDVAVTGPLGGGDLWVAQELPDGRRSPFEPVAVPAAAGAQP